jgi:site-specific DNA-methyltransferase (adenine-specific)
MTNRSRPGLIRDAIVAFLRSHNRAAHLTEIHKAVEEKLGEQVPASSVRSYLRLNTPGSFRRTGRGEYLLVEKSA